MTDEIGRADYVLGVDKSGVTKGVAEAESEIKASGQRAEKEYSASGQRAGEGWGRATAAGVKAVTTAAVTAIGLATKGAIELQNASADFRAETGATVADADRAGKAINGMFKRNVQGIGEIGGALTKVHTDLGLVGDEAEQITERFLRFARVTKQEASASVLAFDDILDAWGLQATDAGLIMDKLIASHQEYGGSIAENQRALANMAPQLRALNLTVDDGIGLLNLFAASGLDAAKGQVALNTAITKLPPGTTLQEFLANLAMIEDDGIRARVAIEVFGQKAGPALANAIRPGSAALEDFKISTQDATGALDEANQALDDTFGARAQRLVREFVGGLNDIGPALTGAAGIVSIAGSLGVDNLVRAVGPKLVAGMKAAGARGGEALADGMSAVWQGATGTVIGNNIATRLENVFDASKQTRVGKAAMAAGTKLGAVWGAAMAAGGKLTELMAVGLSRLPFAPAVRSAALTAGLLTGGVFGAGMATGVKLAAGGIVAAAVAAIAEQIQGPINDLGRGIHKALLGDENVLADIGRAWGQWRRDTPWPLGQKDAPDWASLGRDVAAGAEGMMRPIPEAISAATEAARNGAAAIPQALGSGLAGGQTQVNLGAVAMLGGLATAWAAGQERARIAAEKVALGFYYGIIEKQGVVEEAMANAVYLSENTMDKAQEIAYLTGVLTSKEMARGLNDKRANVRQAFEEARAVAEERLGQISIKGGNVGKDTTKALADGMKDKDPLVREQTRRSARLIENGLAETRARQAGQDIDAELVTGLNDRSGAVAAAAWMLGIRAARAVLAGVRAVASGGGGDSGGRGPQPGAVDNATDPARPRLMARGGAFEGLAIAGEEGPELLRTGTMAHLDPTRRLGAMLASALRPMQLAAAGGLGGQAGGLTTIGDIHVTASFPNVRDIRNYTPADLDDLELALGNRLAGALMRRKY